MCSTATLLNHEPWKDLSHGELKGDYDCHFFHKKITGRQLLSLLIFLLCENRLTGLKCVSFRAKATVHAENIALSRNGQGK